MSRQLTTRQVAETLGVTRRRVNQLVLRGELPAVRGGAVGGPHAYLFERSAVEDWLTQQQTPEGLLTTAEVAQRAGTGTTAVATAIHAGELVAIFAPNPAGGRYRRLFDSVAVDVWIALRKTRSESNGRYWRICYPCADCQARVTRPGTRCPDCRVEHRRQIAAERRATRGDRPIQLNGTCAAGCGKPVRQKNARCASCKRVHERERLARAARQRRAAARELVLAPAPPVAPVAPQRRQAGRRTATPATIQIVSGLKTKAVKPVAAPRSVPPGPRDAVIAAGRAAWESEEYTVTPPGGEPIRDPRGFWLVSEAKGFRHEKVGATLETGERPVEVHRFRPGCGWESQALNMKPTPPKEPTS